jgi:hypothetical protein
MGKRYKIEVQNILMGFKIGNPWSLQMSSSLTKVTTHEKCALKYKFRYIMNLPETKGAAASRGVDNHKSIEDFIAIGTPLPSNLEFYHGWLESMRGPMAFPEHKIAVDSKWQLCGWEDPDAYLRAVVDLKYIVSPESIVNYDWKTGKIYPDHVDQKQLYAAMVSAEHPDALEIKSIHVYVDLNKNTEQSYHRDWIPNIKAGWDVRIERVARDEQHMPSPGYHCTWCGYSRKIGGPCRF